LIGWPASNLELMADRLPLRRLARVTGLLYLVIIVGAGFAEGYVRGTLVVPGDAAATASNVLASQGLFRLGFAADLVAFLADAAVAVLLYVLLRPAGRTLALLAAAFRLVAHPAIASLNLLNHIGALLVLDGTVSAPTLDPAQLEASALFLMELHRYGYLIGGAFFGVHCALLGVLLVRSELFPSLLGWLLGLAAVGYVIESFTHVLAPGLGGAASALVVVTAGVGEVSLCLYLLVKGVRHVPPAAARIANASAAG
jgi:hypothetical protein